MRTGSFIKSRRKRERIYDCYDYLFTNIIYYCVCSNDRTDLLDSLLVTAKCSDVWVCRNQGVNPTKLRKITDKNICNKLDCLMIRKCGPVLQINKLIFLL